VLEKSRIADSSCTRLTQPEERRFPHHSRRTTHLPQPSSSRLDTQNKAPQSCHCSQRCIRTAFGWYCLRANCYRPDRPDRTPQTLQCCRGSRRDIVQHCSSRSSNTGLRSSRRSPPGTCRLCRNLRSQGSCPGCFPRMSADTVPLHKSHMQCRNPDCYSHSRCTVTRDQGTEHTPARKLVNPASHTHGAHAGWRTARRDLRYCPSGHVRPLHEAHCLSVLLVHCESKYWVELHMLQSAGGGGGGGDDGVPAPHPQWLPPWHRSALRPRPAPVRPRRVRACAAPVLSAPRITATAIRRAATCMAFRTND